MVDILQLPDQAPLDSFSATSELETEAPFTPVPVRQVQVLLWDHVEGLLKEAEQEEVKQALGAAAIEENGQLFKEAESLDEILGDLQRGGEKQAEMQRLFQTPARSLVEDEIRLLLETIHCSSSEVVPKGGVNGHLTDTLAREPEPGQEPNEPESPSDSFYSFKELTPTRPKGASDTGQETSTIRNGSLAGYDERLGPYTPLAGFTSRRDCHSAPILARSDNDRRIVEYLTARPASSGSQRPRTSDGRTLLRPGTAQLPRPQTSSLHTLQRPQTAADRGFVHSVGSLRSNSPGWGSPSLTTPGLTPRDSDAPDASLASTPGSFAPRSSSDWGRPSSGGRGVAGSSRPSTGSSVGGCEPKHVVAAVADRLDVYRVETVAGPLRQALADERAALLEDIDFLHQLIDEEADSSHKASRPPPSIKDLKDYSARLEASLRAHIAEARLKQEQESAALSKQNGRSRRPNLTGVANGRGVEGKLGNGVQSGDELDRRAQLSRKAGAKIKGGKVEVAERQIRSEADSVGFGVAMANGSCAAGNSVEVRNVGTNGMRAETSVSLAGADDAFDESWESGSRLRCSSKVQRLRTLVSDSQTEAAGAASLCQAQIS